MSANPSAKFPPGRMMPFAKNTARWVLVGLLALIAGGLPTLRAQQEVPVISVQVEAPVFNDNIEDAKNRAIQIGQREALLAMVRDLVAEEWIVIYGKDLRRNVLNRKSRFIRSFRVEQGKTSLDRTLFSIDLSAQIDRKLLSRKLRELSLPLKTDPPVSLSLYYPRGDPLLGIPRTRAEVMKRIGERLTLLNFKVRRTGAVDAKAARLLGDFPAEISERVRWLRRVKSTVALYVSYDRVSASPAGNGNAPGAKGKARLYRRADGRLLATIDHALPPLKFRPPGRSQRQRASLMAAWVDPLILRMQPGTFRLPESGPSGQAPLKLRVLGFSSIVEQDAFERSFFLRTSLFARFRMAGMSHRTVTYEGPFGGDRANLERILTGKEFGEFQVRGAFWFNDVLEIDVRRKKKPHTRELLWFHPTQRPPEVQEALDEHFMTSRHLDIGEPYLAEREENGWLERANTLAFNAAVYGRVDSRADRDVYVGEAVTPGEIMTFIWALVGRTLLSPAIRIYNEEGVLVRSFFPTTWIRYRYRVPKGESRFYVEISDRFGHLKVDTGGYLKFHYLFKAEREQP